MSRGGTLPAARSACYGIAARLSGADGVLLGLDFDGTLAPITTDPDEPTITPACRRAVESVLAHPHTAVAVISGRELGDLRDRVHLPGVVYAGNHGLELLREGRIEVHPRAASSRRTLQHVLDRISDRLSDVPGLEVEDKGLTATVHVRRTPPRRIDEVRSAVETAVQAAGDLRISSGKQVFEIRPDVEWDKGATMDRLTANVPDGWGTVYVGDDTTDEDAFRAVRPEGVGVLVGARDRTAATHRLPARESVAPFLEWLTWTVLSPPLRDERASPAV